MLQRNVKDWIAFMSSSMLVMYVIIPNGGNPLFCGYTTVTLGNTGFPASQCTWEGFHAGINKG